MTPRPTTIQAAQSILSAAKTMRECDVGAVPVMVEDKLVGILTDRDIVVRGVATGLELENHQVQEVMSLEPKTVKPDTSFEEAAQIMSEAKVRRLPVAEDGKLVGLISLGDMAVAHKGHEDMCGVVLENVSRPIGPKCAM
ncbi:MAG: CBS domain-containing protein [Actinomycetota bacterium]|nr:CBS domain-containing protein [Actinomycetota bacterium]